MNTRGLTIALTLSLAAPAHATTYKGRADAGPAIAGDSVLWGQEYSDDSGALKLDGRVIARFPAPTGDGHSRRFGGVPGAVAGSPTRIAYTVVDSQVIEQGSDYVVSSAKVTSYLSTGGPFTNPLGCEASYISTAIEGDNVAFGVNARPPCGGVYVNGHKIDDRGEMREVKLAGAYVAWLDAPGGGGDRITVADVATGTIVATFPAAPRHSWYVFDIDAQGNIVAVQDNQLVAFSVSDARQRVLARSLWSAGVAVAGGRVAYITHGEPTGAGRLVVTDLQGKVLKRLERYGAHRWPVGELALSERRIAWSVRRGTSEQSAAPGTVRTVKL